MSRSEVLLCTVVAIAVVVLASLIWPAVVTWQYSTLVEHCGGRTRVLSNWPYRVGLDFSFDPRHTDHFGDLVHKLRAWNAIRKLDIGGESINDTAFADICMFPNLQDMYIYGAHISPVGWNQARKLQLTSLTVAHMDLRKPALDDLCAAGTLQTLIIMKCEMSSDGISHLDKLTHLAELTFLSAYCGDDNCIILGKLPMLTNLILTDAGITNEGLKQIAESKTLSYLSVHGNKVTADGFKILGRCHSLQTLSVEGDLLEETKKALPMLQVVN